MSYRTILVHLTDARRVTSLVDAAGHVAAREKAHVVGLYVMPPIPTYATAGAGVSLVQSTMNELKADAEKVHEAFESAARPLGVPIEWRLAEPRLQTVADVVLDHARAADLIVAGQKETGSRFAEVLDVPEDIAVESGRPVLLIPHSGHFPTFGKRVALAWNGRKEATRAAFDALPLLKAAETVRIIWVNPQKEGQARIGDLPTAEIAATLARHGVKCEASTSVAPEIAVGDALLSGLVDDGCDLLVMGAYGHSRMRERLFGGVTRLIFEHMTVPVLMSH